MDLQANVVNLREAATAAVALLVRLLHDRDVVRESDARAFLLKAVQTRWPDHPDYGRDEADMLREIVMLLDLFRRENIVRDLGEG